MKKHGVNDPKRNNLFRPSLQGREGVGQLPLQRPWRLSSQFYVAFIGGILALTGIAYLNGKRLGLSDVRLRIIVALGIAVTLISLAALSYGIKIADLEGENGQWIRLILRMVSVALFPVLYKIQKSADRIYQFNHDGDDDLYSSLWVPGIIATLVLGLVQAILSLIIL